MSSGIYRWCLQLCHYAYNVRLKWMKILELINLSSEFEWLFWRKSSRIILIILHCEDQISNEREFPQSKETQCYRSCFESRKIEPENHSIEMNLCLFFSFFNSITNLSNTSQCKHWFSFDVRRRVFFQRKNPKLFASASAKWLLTVEEKQNKRKKIDKKKLTKGVFYGWKFHSNRTTTIFKVSCEWSVFFSFENQNFRLDICIDWWKHHCVIVVTYVSSFRSNKDQLSKRNSNRMIH